MNKLPSIYDCYVSELPRMQFRAGNLTSIHENEHIPFDINRIFYLYDIPGGEDRGAHAHITCHQFIIAASGCFDIQVDDGVNKKTITLNRPYYGLYIPPMVWAQELSFSSGSICLVLASHNYNEADYIREYSTFKNIRKNVKPN